MYGQRCAVNGTRTIDHSNYACARIAALPSRGWCVQCELVATLIMNRELL